MGGEIVKGRQESLSNLYVLNLTQRNNLMTEFQTPDDFLQGVCMSSNQKSHLWITTKNHAGSPLNPSG